MFFSLGVLQQFSASSAPLREKPISGLSLSVSTQLSRGAPMARATRLGD